MARRNFDSNFSRRPAKPGGGGGGGSSQYSLLGEPTGLSAYGSSGGGGGYDDYPEDIYAASQQASEYEEVYSNKYEPEQQQHRVPRDGGGGQRSHAADSGGWRKRSPSPTASRFSNRSQESDRVSRQPQPQWNRPQQSAREVYDDRSSRLELEVQQQQQQFQQQQQSNPFVTSIQNNSAGLIRNPLANQGPVVMVLPHGQSAAGGLMGNMGISNPFGVLAQSIMPTFNPSPFGQQQIIQQAPVYGQGVGQQPLNIYGPQTQQGFNRFEVSSQRSGSSGGDRRSSRNDRASSGVRRSDSRTPVKNSGGGGGGPGRNSDPPSRKRNLVLRDPRPDDAVDRKRARTSGARGNRGGANKGKPTQVKRISLGEEKTTGKDNRYKRKSNANNKDKKAAAAASEGAAVVKTEEGEESKAATGDSSKNKDAKDKKDKDRKTKFDEFPTSILVCKVCQKVMNDGASFESHLSGRAHVALMKILEERFTKRSELLMIESKCSEDEIGIEMERQRRAGKGGRAEKNSNNYCKMCDCNYVVNWGTHKVSLGHRVLKEFLHPTCRFCKTHFMHRIDWVTHLLSHSHLKKIHEIKIEGTIPLAEQESPSQDELFAINMELARDERPTNAITIRSLDGKESLTEEMKEILKNDRGEIELPTGEIPIPEKYDENTEVGEEAIVGVSGSRCRVCRVYIAEDKDVEAHCKSKDHFTMYVSFLKRVVRHREHKEEEKKAAEEKAKKEEEKKVRDAERAEKKKLADQEKAEKKAAEIKVEDSGDKTADKESAMDTDGEKVVAETSEEQTEGEMETEDAVLVDEIGGDEEEQEEEEEEEDASADAETVVDEGEAGVEDAVVAAADVEMTEQNGDQEITKPSEIPKVVDTTLPIIEKTKEVENTVEETKKEVVVIVEETKKEVLVIVEETKDKVEETVEETKKEVVAAIEDKPEEVVETPKNGEKEKEEAEVVVPVTPTKAVTQTATRSPRGRGGFVRGTPARGRGAQSLKNVTPRVDSNFRGGSNNRGQARGGRPQRGNSPRGGPRGGRGRPANR